ncbi:hypothetical protein [Rhizosaccharibacter radicis]|uniref:UrcA family protein n=1 Tax=Rhizosaccharibacter radicis TaxID=2782605 RepID=A0ABT1W1K7_9PROT|nr:hypothetical protein [Acetobacteraceae bacterium KSS12]
MSLWLLAGLGHQVWADEQTEPLRLRLELALAVLRDEPQAASASCIDVMKQVQTTERRARADRGDAVKRQADRDELMSAYENAWELCGTDAARVCRDAPLAGQQKNCRALERHPELD